MITYYKREIKKFYYIQRNFAVEEFLLNSVYLYVYRWIERATSEKTGFCPRKNEK